MIDRYFEMSPHDSRMIYYSSNIPMERGDIGEDEENTEKCTDSGYDYDISEQGDAAGKTVEAYIRNPVHISPENPYMIA
jgi:hypothetical protein